MIAAVILIPMAGVCLCLFVGRRIHVVGVVITAATLFAVVALVSEVWRQGTVTHQLGGWGAPLGIELRADGLAAVMLLMSALTTLPIALYAASYYGAAESGRGRPGNTFWPLMLLLWAALNALFLSSDVFNLYVCLELMTLAAVGLVLLSDDGSALVAAMRYLLAAFVGSMLYLLGVAILYASYGVLGMSALTSVVSAEPATLLAVSSITVALAVKTALFPLHFWLPRAHAAAPAPVSALLSSLVVTASFYLLLRLWSGPFAAVVSQSAGHLLGGLGTAAIVWGSLQALRQQRLKVMIAYSTVAQVGYLMLLFPLITAALIAPGPTEPWVLDAWTGGVYHAISHGLAKAAMFLAAGTIVRSLGDDRIIGISGIARHLPMTTYAFGIAGMTLIGLPPSGGFVAKWLMLSAALSSGQWWWAVAMLLGGFLTAGYVFLVLGQELSLSRADQEGKFQPVPRTMEYAAMALALGALLLGIRVNEPLVLLRVGLPFGGP